MTFAPRQLVYRSGDRRHLPWIDVQHDLLASVKGFARFADDAQALSSSRERHHIFPIFSEKRGFEHCRRYAQDCLITRRHADRSPAFDADALRSERERELSGKLASQPKEPFSRDR